MSDPNTPLASVADLVERAERLRREAARLLDEIYADIDSHTLAQHKKRTTRKAQAADGREPSG